jgi:L-ascorbate metabolism protein UlaG (beta-lactamase superfamily)
VETETLLILPSTDRSVPADSGSILFVGNATVLIRFGGLSVLTDPTFIHRYESVSIGYGMSSTRLTDPAVEIGDLPPLDLILLSHFHGDHFDQVAERQLDKSVPVVTNREAARALRQRGFRQAKSVETWSSVLVEKGEARLRITAMPGRHGPPLSDLIMPDVMGSMLEFESPGGRSFRLYITGDTLVTDQLREIPRRYPDIDLALLHLGGTRLLGMLVTMDAKQGVEMMQLVRAHRAIPVHYDDYDVFKSPLTDFHDAAAAAGLDDRVQYLRHGETYTFHPSAKRAAA